MHERMTRDDPTSELQEALQLAPSEAAIYVQLATSGPAKAADLAAALKLHRNEVYRTTARMIQRGLVEMTLEHPARFAAVPHARVFDVELDARMAAVSALRDARERIGALLASRVVPDAPERRSAYKVVQGRSEIAVAQRHLVGQAQRSVDWASTFPMSVPLADLTGILDSLAARVAEGVRARVVVREEARRSETLRALAASGCCEVRITSAQRDVRFVVMDGSSLLMWVVTDPSDALKTRDEVAIQTTAEGLVQAEALLFEQLWGAASPL